MTDRQITTLGLGNEFEGFLDQALRVPRGHLGFCTRQRGVREASPNPWRPRCLERKLGEAMVKHDIMAHVPYVSTLQSSVAI